MSRIAVMLVGLVCSIEAFGQNYPLYDSYITNPFLINPAETGTSHFRIFANYRNQWNGLTGAPKIASIGASTLINETRAGIGFKASSFKRGFLNTSDISLAYSYGVPINKSNTLFFGLSGGILSNSVDWQMVSDQNIDPALNNLTSSITPAMSFGMLLRNASGFNLGITLPQMFETKSFNDNFAIGVQDNAVLSAYYSNWHPQAKSNTHNRRRKSARARKSQGSPVELFSLFRYSNVGIQAEGAVKLNMGSSFWLSAGYRKVSGVVPGIGINLNVLSINYFYESGIAGDIPLKSHEVSIGLKLGAEKKFRDQPKHDEKPTIAPPRPRFGGPDTNAPKISDQKQKPMRLPNATETKSTETKKEPEVKKEPVVTKTEPKKEPEVKKEPVVTKTEPKKEPEVKKDPVVTQTETKKEPEVKKEPVVTQTETKKDPVVTTNPTVTEEKKDPVVEEKKDPVTTTTTSTPRLNSNQVTIQPNTEVVPQHEDEQEKLDRLTEHADNPTEEHTGENQPHAERHEFVKRGTHQSELELGDYVVVGVFRGEVNAKHFSDELKKLGFSEVDYGYLSEKNIWYVHIADSEDIEEAKAKRDKYRKMKMFKDAWLLTVHQ